MNPSDIVAVLQWWITLFLLGLAFLPLTTVLFRTFFDKGYIFAKLLGLILTSYAVFLLGLLHLIPFHTISIYSILLIIAVLIFYKWRINIRSIIKQYGRIFILEEVIFLSALFFWSYIHSFSPDIHGLEKYMDYGFINSILRTEYFPPTDMWFPPHFINYYYFGHLMTAVLTKLSQLPSSYTFNLMLSTIFAFCFTQSFSIAANLYSFLQRKEKLLPLKRFVAGILSALLVTFAGNLHILYAFFKAYPNEFPVPLWQLPFLPFSFPNAYWYPNATRFIHNTIHEFPMYSWTVADLHGHVLDIPLVLLTIALLLSFFSLFTKSETTPSKSTKTVKAKKIKSVSKVFLGYIKLLKSPTFGFLHLLTISFLLAVMYMTNAWDGAIYLLLTALVIFYVYWERKIDYKMIFVSLLFVIIGFAVFVLPYNINFKPFVSGIGILCSPEFLIEQKKLGPLLFEADHCQHSLWWQLIMLYGFFYFFVVSFFIFIARVKKIFHVDQFILLLIILSTLLIILPELIYVKDIYPAHYRANTMFKLAFQAFIMLSLVSGYVMVRIITSTKRRILALLYIIPSALLVSLVLLYPYQSVKSYYGELKTYRGLDGTAYLSTLYPSDYEAIKWLNKHVTGQPVIVEAQGDSYTDFARVSSNTGLPTVLGWPVHEWLWRGSYDIPSPRIDEVKKIYESKDLSEVSRLLKKHTVEYVFIGALEYQKYPELSEDILKQLGTVVFQKDTTKIYQMN